MPNFSTVFLFLFVYTYTFPFIVIQTLMSILLKKVPVFPLPHFFFFKNIFNLLWSVHIFLLILSHGMCMIFRFFPFIFSNFWLLGERTESQRAWSRVELGLVEKIGPLGWWSFSANSSIFKYMVQSLLFANLCAHDLLYDIYYELRIVIN